MKESKILACCSVLLLLILLPTDVNCRGKTYDDLEDVLKNDAEGKLKTRPTHVGASAPVDTENIDSNKVVKAS